MQYGNGLPAFRGAVLQRGYGVGGLFRGLFKSVIPAAKTTLKTAARRAVPLLKSNLKNIGKQVLKQGIQELDSFISDDTEPSINRRGNSRVAVKRKRVSKVKGAPRRKQRRIFKNGQL